MLAQEKLEKFELQAVEAHIAALNAEKAYNSIRQQYASSAKVAAGKVGDKHEEEEPQYNQENLDIEAEQISKSDPAFAAELGKLKEKRAQLGAARLENEGDERRLRARVQKERQERQQREEPEAQRAKEDEDKAKREEQEARRRARAEATANAAQADGGEAPSKKSRPTNNETEVDAEMGDKLDPVTSVLGDAISVSSGPEETAAASDQAIREQRKKQKKDAIERVKQRAADLDPRARGE